MDDSRTRRANGRRSREAILTRGLGLAAAKGAAAVSIGAIATALGMSKSAVFAHFGSKAALESALLAAAAARVAATVLDAAALAPPGVARLIALSEAWLAHPADGPLGLLLAAGDGLGADGRSARQAWRRQWRTALETQLTAAVQSGELPPAIDVPQAAFEIDAMLMAGRRDDDLGDTRAAARARRGVEALVLRWSQPARAPVPS